MPTTIRYHAQRKHIIQSVSTASEVHIYSSFWCHFKSTLWDMYHGMILHNFVFVYVYLVRFIMLPTAYLVIPPCTLLAHIHMSLVDPISVRSCAWIRRQTITLILVHTSLTCQYWRGMDTCYFGCWRSGRKNTSAGLCRNGWVVGYLWTYLSVSFWCDAFVYVQDTDQQSYNSYYWM